MNIDIKPETDPITDEAPAGSAASDDDEYEPDDDEDDADVVSNKARPHVHTIISAVKRDIDKNTFEHCKVYIAANVSVRDRAHVVGRIRHFAG